MARVVGTPLRRDMAHHRRANARAVLAKPSAGLRVSGSISASEWATVVSLRTSLMTTRASHDPASNCSARAPQPFDPSAVRALAGPSARQASLSPARRTSSPRLDPGITALVRSCPSGAWPRPGMAKPSVGCSPRGGFWRTHSRPLPSWRCARAASRLVIPRRRRAARVVFLYTGIRLDITNRSGSPARPPLSASPAHRHAAPP